MIPRDTYTDAECAALLGESTGRFQKLYAQRVALDGMPASITSVGRRRHDRAAFDAWRRRHHPAAPKQAPANDAGPTPWPHAGAWADFLSRTYAR